MGSVVPSFIVDQKILTVPVCNVVGICSTGVKSSGAHRSGGQDSGVHVPLKRILGGSVLFHVIEEPGVELEEISWSFGPGLKYRVMLRVHNGSEKTPTLVYLQDKYKQRVHVPYITSLRIESLTHEDSGYYRARASFTGGVESTQIFHLTVYDPVPRPQILVWSLSITAGWCNVTLECRAGEVTEDLNVTWESKGLPRELEQRGTPGPAPNSWTLNVSLPLSQPNANLTCVVSNSEDQKTVTSALGEFCDHASTVLLVCVFLRTRAQEWGLCRGVDHATNEGVRPLVLDAEKGVNGGSTSAEQKAEREKDGISSLASKVTRRGWVSVPIRPEAITTH
ncbi:PREDICTED: SLAM family member 8-like [Ceratotherium simum simum]|uniref:SLAM family member 8-like n=1 Tax=Ceratotherium simum simum TaxID=73337 RepID=A0ABM1D5Y0_CERSS|nr:PREDICTED: SLAM family member 8-like [Ceratotherium simum simum]